MLLMIFVHVRILAFDRRNTDLIQYVLRLAK
jgi:hypothetical protein